MTRDHMTVDDIEGAIPRKMAGVRIISPFQYTGARPDILVRRELEQNASNPYPAIAGYRPKVPEG